MFVMDLYPFFRQDAYVPHIVLNALVEGREFLLIAKFHDLGLVGTLTELAPHGVQHHLGQGTHTSILCDQGRIQFDTFFGLVVAEILLAFLRIVANMGRATANFIFVLQPRVDLIVRKSRHGILKMPHLMYVKNMVTFFNSFLQLWGAPRTDDLPLLVSVYTDSTPL